MDLLRLDRSSTYIPDKIIEGFSSLIWTERYDTPGEFELKTGRVEETMSALPGMSLVSLLDSREVMFVETHSIDLDDNGNPELTITGRSLPAFLEYRALRGRGGADYYNTKYFMINNFWADDAVSIMLWNAFVNTTSVDVTLTSYQSRNTRAAISNFVITNSTSGAGSYGATRWLEPGPLYPQVMAFVHEDGHGLRGIRPDVKAADGGFVVTTVNTTTGYPTYVYTNPCTSLRLDLYHGVDRSIDAANPVVFSYELGHIDNPKYLFSNKDALTEFYKSSVYGLVGHSRADATSATGFDFREGLELAAAPDGSGSSASYLENLGNEVDAELIVKNFKQYFTGDISPFNPYTYGPSKDYYLGDTVTLLGEYDIQQDMLVSEYVRSQDAEGEVGYPGLVML